jgi:hypothetical protein
MRAIVAAVAISTLLWTAEAGAGAGAAEYCCVCTGNDAEVCDQACMMVADSAECDSFCQSRATSCFQFDGDCVASGTNAVCSMAPLGLCTCAAPATCTFPQEDACQDRTAPTVTPTAAPVMSSNNLFVLAVLVAGVAALRLTRRARGRG